MYSYECVCMFMFMQLLLAGGVFIVGTGYVIYKALTGHENSQRVVRTYSNVNDSSRVSKNKIQESEQDIPELQEKRITHSRSKKVTLNGQVTTSKIDSLSKEQYKLLKNVQDARESALALNSSIFLGKVVKVLDGDTIKAIVTIDNTPTKFTFRLAGIDTPEIRKGEFKEFGKQVKQILQKMISTKIVKIKAGGVQKYGRILRTVYVWSKGKQICLNDFLIEHNMAKSYEGKAKIEFTEEDEESFSKTNEDMKWPKITNFPFNKI